MGSTPSVTTTYAYDKIAMLVTLLAEHWPLSTTYKLDWRSWLLGNCQLKVSNDRQCRFLVSVFKFTDNGSNSRVWMPGGSEDKDGGQGRCRYQWYTNTTHWLCLLTATIHPQYGVYARFAPLCWHQGAWSRDTLTRSPQGLRHGGIYSQALDKVNVKLVPKQNKKKQPKALLSVAVFANSSVVLLAGVCFSVLINTN